MQRKILSMLFLCICFFSCQTFSKTEISPEQSRQLIHEASALIASDPQKAIETLKMAVVYDPDNDKAHYMLGNGLMKLGGYFQAEIEYRKAYNMHPKDEYEIALARSLLLQSRADEVIDIVKYKGLNKHNTILKLNMRAKAYLIRGDHAKAIETLHKVIDVDPDNNEALIEMTRNHILEKDFDAAKAAIGKVLTKEPDNIDALTMQGEALLTLGAYRDATHAYNKILKLDPQHIEAFSGRARVALLQGAYNKALVDGRQIIRHDPYHPMGRYIIASALFSTGNVEHAAKVYASLPANSKPANFPPSLLLQAKIKYHQEDYTKAEILLKRYRYFHPDDPKGHQMFGLIKLKTNAHHQAVNSFSKIIQENPNNIDAFNGLASAHVRMKDYSDAQKVFRDILRQFKNHPKTSYARTALRYFCSSPLSSLDCNNAEDSDIAQEMISIIDMIFIEDIDDAEISLRHLETVYPDNLDVKALHSTLYLQKNEIENAYKNYLRIVQKNPNHEQTLAGLLYLARNKDLQGEIFKVLDSSYKQNPTTYLGVQVATLAHNKGDTAYAEQILNRLIRQDPNGADIYFALLTIYNASNADKAKSKNLIRNALKRFKTPFLQEQFLGYAETLKDLRFMKETLEIYSKSVQKPEPSLLLKYGQIQMTLGNKKAARNIFKGITRYYPYYEPAYKHLVQLYIKNKEFREARKTVNKMDVHSSLKTILFAHIDYFSGNPKLGIERLKDAYNIFKKNDILYALYELYNIQGQKNKALKTLADHYQPKDKPDIKIAMALGTYYLKTKEYTKADIILRPLIGMPEAGRSGDALNNIALARYYNYHDDALYLIEAALRIDPNNLDYKKSFIVIGTANKKYKDVLRMAFDYKINPNNVDDPSVLFALAQCYAKIKNKSSASRTIAKLERVKGDFFEKSQIPDLKNIVAAL